MRLFHSLTVMLTLASFAAAEDKVEKIDNPEFAAWAKHKPGTRVTLKTVTEMGETRSQIVITNTLVSVGDEKHVIETVVTSSLNGIEMKGRSSKRDVEKKIVLPKGVNRETYGKKPDGTVEEGTETIKVAVGEFKAKWYRMKSENNGVKFEGKMWLSEDVPGQLLRGETATSGQVSTKTVMELIEFKKP